MVVGWLAVPRAPQSPRRPRPGGGSLLPWADSGASAGLHRSAPSLLGPWGIQATAGALTPACLAQAGFRALSCSVAAPQQQRPVVSARHHLQPTLVGMNHTTPNWTVLGFPLGMNTECLYSDG